MRSRTRGSALDLLTVCVPCRKCAARAPQLQGCVGKQHYVRNNRAAEAEREIGG